MRSNNIPFTWNVLSHEIVNGFEGLLKNNDKVNRTLIEYGAILFKGLMVNSLDKFGECMNSFSETTCSYIDGNSPRMKLTSKIYTSTEYPPELSISMHNELSYSNSWPAKLFFCCVTPPLTGGSTLIADSRKILASLPLDLKQVFASKGVMYVRNLHGGKGVTIGKSWMDTFETNSRDAVESICNQSDIKFEWKSDGSLRLIQKRPAVATHPLTMESVWFNQVDQFHPSTNPPEVYKAITEIYKKDPFEMPQYGCFGDGSPISDSILSEIRSITAEHIVAFPWEEGDLLVIDNMLTAHGRAPYSGKRKILVAMTS